MHSNLTQPPNTAAPLRGYSDFTLACAVFAAALLARLLFLYASPDRAWPHSIFYEGDALTWIEWARALRQGEDFELDLPLRTPGVAYLLYWLPVDATQPPFTAIKVIWCTLSAAACAVAYLCFARVFSRRIALIATALCVFSFGLHVIATSLNNETIYLLLVMGIVLATLKLLRRPAVWLAIALGLLHGLATLVRAEHSLLLVMLLGYLAWRWHVRAHAGEKDESAGSDAVANIAFHQCAMMLGCVFIASIAICLPWSIHGANAIRKFNTVADQTPPYELARPVWTDGARKYLNALPAFTRESSFGAATYYNATKGKREITAADVEAFFLDVYGYVPEPISPFVLVSMKGGLDFALANHPDADGGFSKAAMISLGEPDTNLYPARPDHLRLINHGFAVGWGFITSDVKGWMGLVGRKLTNFADGITLGFTACNLPHGHAGVRRPVDMITPNPGSAATIWQLFVYASLVFGIVIAAMRKQAGIWLVIIAYKLIVTALFYGYARQAVSILPAFFIFMAIAFDMLIGRLHSKVQHSDSWRVAGRIGLAVMLVALFGIEIAAAFSNRQLAVNGPVQLTPELGVHAFRSDQFLHIEPAAPRSD